MESTRSNRSAITRPTHKTLTESTADAIREAIEQGKFPIGSQVPTETELIEMLSVSRTTVREALRILEEQGLIVRRRGLGRYVTQRAIVKDLSINFGITEMITQAGFLPGTQQSSIYFEPAAPAAAEALQIREGARVLVVDRVRTADEQPVVWSKDYMNAEDMGSNVPEAFDLEHQSLYSYLKERTSSTISHGTAQVAPVLATAEIAAKLNVRKGSALLLICQTDYRSDDSPVIYSIEYHVPDKFVFVIHRKGPDA